MSDADKLWAVDPALAAAYRKIKASFAFSYPDSSLSIAQGFRTPAVQIAAHASTAARPGGASPFNGVTSFSFHQNFPSSAIDVAVVGPGGTGPGGYVENGSDARYSWVGHSFEAAGFIWGGRFQHPHPDPDHVQTTGHSPRSPAEAAVALTAYQAALAARGQTA